MTAVGGICGTQKAFWKTWCTERLTQLSLLLPHPATTSYTRSLLLRWLVQRQCGTGGERQSRAAAKENHPGEGYN